MRVTLRVFFWQLFFCISTIICGQEIKKTAPATWVKRLEYPKESTISKYDVKSGSYFRLIDYQINFVEEESFNHFVTDIVNSGGVSKSSQLQLSFDSSYQELIFHSLKIWRRGVQIDKKESISFEYVKNEEQLQSSIYSGNVTALVIIDDLRKNDILEYSYTIKGFNPIYDGAHYKLTPIEDINPLDQISVRFLFDTAKDYTIKCEKYEDLILVSEFDELTEVSITRENVDGFEYEETTPPWIVPYEFVEISNTNSWKSVTDWAISIFEQDENSLTQQVFNEIFYPDFTLDEKIDAIINFVQDDVRYMGIESGIGSIKPFSPDQVIKQRFGDCKDKSLLMSVLLKEIGIANSYPALVNSYLRHNVSDITPSGFAFNHCIVYFEIDGKEYWIDPTYSFQGGSYAEIKTHDYGKALVVRENGESLISMNLDDVESRSEVYELFDFSSFDGKNMLQVKSTLVGKNADLARSILEFYSRKELADLYKYGYGILFAGLSEEKDIKIKDDDMKNIMNLEENYSMNNVWLKDQSGYEKSRVMTYEPSNLYSYFQKMNCEKKEWPVYFEHPWKFWQKTEILLPDNMNFENSSVEIENQAFNYEQKLTLVNPKKALLEYHFESKTDEIDPDHFEKVCTDINEIMGGLVVKLFYPKENQALNRPINIHLITLKNERLRTNNNTFYFNKVEDLRNNTTEIVGMVHKGENQDIYPAAMAGGLEMQIQAFLNSLQAQKEEGIPLELRINKFLISELILNTKQAVLEVEYDVSFTDNGYEYIASFERTLKLPGADVLSNHEKNVRMSIEALLNELTINKFKRVKSN